MSDLLCCCETCYKIDNVKTIEDVFRLLDVLQGTSTITSMQHLKLPISEEKNMASSRVQLVRSQVMGSLKCGQEKQMLAKPNLPLNMDLRD